MSIDWQNALTKLKAEESACLSPKQAAAILHCDSHHITDLIDEGLVEAFDLASAGSSRHCYRIPIISLMAFAESRSTLAPPEHPPSPAVDRAPKEYGAPRGRQR